LIESINIISQIRIELIESQLIAIIALKNSKEKNTNIQTFCFILVIYICNF